MFNGVDNVIELCRFDSEDGKPSRNDATELPSVVLLFPPLDDVVSLSNSKKPAPLPGIVVSTPIFRKSAPTLIVWLPTNFEYVPLALKDFQSIWVGLIAPSVWPAFAS